jgi:hypothetical protein
MKATDNALQKLRRKIQLACSFGGLDLSDCCTVSRQALRRLRAIEPLNRSTERTWLPRALRAPSRQDRDGTIGFGFQVEQHRNINVPRGGSRVSRTADTTDEKTPGLSAGGLPSRLGLLDQYRKLRWRRNITL